MFEDRTKVYPKDYEYDGPPVWTYEENEVLAKSVYANIHYIHEALAKTRAETPDGKDMDIEVFFRHFSAADGPRAIYKRAFMDAGYSEEQATKFVDDGQGYTAYDEDLFDHIRDIMVIAAEIEFEKASHQESKNISVPCN